MLNRRHLRIKVLQALYAYYQSNEDSYRRTENDMMQAIERIYDLYIYLMLTFGELNAIAVRRIEDNKKKALESGNVLTQTIDEEGNLVSVKDIDEHGEQKEISVADLRKELFDGENVVTGKHSDHGLGNVSKVRELPTEMLDALKEVEAKMAEEKRSKKE